MIWEIAIGKEEEFFIFLVVIWDWLIFFLDCYFDVILSLYLSINVGRMYKVRICLNLNVGLRLYYVFIGIN